MSRTIAVVGATGAIGREILAVLAERGFAKEAVSAVASRRSQGAEVSYGDGALKCNAVEHHDFSQTDIALFAAGEATAGEWAEKAAAAGSVAIDLSPRFRRDADIPLIVPEANAEALAGYAKRRIVASPSALAAQLAVALKPLHDAARIRRVVAASYQSVSEAGQAAMDELFRQTRGVFVNDPIVAEELPKEIAFNAVPQVGAFLADGETEAEGRLAAEIARILDPAVKLHATCVYVPVFVGHALAVNIEFEEALTPGAARKILREAPGCMVVDKREDGGYVTPLDCVGDFATFISRIRADVTVPHGLGLWVVSDNMRKGAALNAVQIAETLIARHLPKRNGP